MKKGYKYLAILMFSLSAVFMAFTLKNSFALDDDCTSNDNYCIEWDDDNLTATLTKYQGSATEVVVPATLTRNNKTYSVEVIGGSTTSALFSNNSAITKVTFENGVKAGSTLNHLFYMCTNLKQIVFNNFDTSKVTNMGNMFYGCKNIETLDLSGFNTSNVTTMERMFKDCTKLKNLNVSSFNTSEVKNMAEMFNSCDALRTLDMSSFTSEKLQNIYYMFKSTSLTQITIGKFNFLYPDISSTLTSKKEAYNFGRGTWKRTSDGKEFAAADIVYDSRTKDMSGTYVKQSSIIKEMFIDYNVTYKIDKITKIDEVQFSNDNFKLEDNGIYVTNLNQVSTDDYTVPGNVKVLFKDVVSDNAENKYNLRLTIDNIHLYDLNTGVDDENISHLFMNISSSTIAMDSYYYKTNGSKLSYDKPSKFDVMMEVVDDNGVVQNGSYVFSARDLDIPSVRDKNSAYPYDETAGYGQYSEGINLLAGYDIDTLKLYKHSFIVKDGNRLFGIQVDESSEFTEFSIKVDAKKFKYTWTGEGCATNVLRYYQPTFVNIIKQDNSGNNLSGAKLSLYSGDTLVESWTSTTDAKKLFLNPGYYTLKETKAPTNYNKASDLSFYVDVNGKIIVDGEEKESIILKNTPIPVVRVIVKYIDEDTNEELAKITEEKRKGDTYTSVEKTFDGYILTRKPESETVTLNQDETVLIYYYHRLVYITTEVKGEGGTIKGDETVNYHNDSTPDNIVIEADKDYFIDKITINNIEVEVTNDKKMILPNFTNMEENKHIVVSFVPLTPDVPKTDINTILPILGIVTMTFGLIFVYMARSDKNEPKKKILVSE